MWLSYVLLGSYLLGCVLLGLLIALLTSSECITTNCWRMTYLMNKARDPATAPCHDFYRFACGNYRGLHRSARLDKGSMWEDIDEVQIRLLVDFLERKPAEQDDRILRVLKLVYKSCLDDEEIDRQGLMPVLRSIQLAEGFPLLQGPRWDKNISGKERSWDDIEYGARSAGFKGGHLLDCYLEVQEEDGRDHYYIHLTIPSNLELDAANEQYFFTYVEKISQILNATTSEDRLKEINDTLKFRLDLANIAVRPENCSYIVSVEPLDDFVKDFEFLNMKPFFENMSPYVQMPTHIVVSHLCKKYLSALRDLMEKTPQRIVANYLMIENIIEVTSFLPQSMRKPLIEFREKSKDPDHRVEPTKKTLCAKAVKSKMSSALSALYIREHFPVYEEPTFLMNSLSPIRSEVKRMVSNFKWLSKKDKRAALKKIDSLAFASPVPEQVHRELTDLTAFRVYYEDLCFIGNTTSTLASYMILQQFETDKEWELLERPPTVFDENVDIFSGRVTYDDRRHAIVVPMGYAKYPAFDKYWPQYLTYGGLGARVAQALLEAAGVVEAGGGITTCHTARYGEYVEAHLGVAVTDPNCAVSTVARAAGLRAAYQAYVRHEGQRFFRERQLLGMEEYSPRQMFFLDFATFHCRTPRAPFKAGMTQGDVIDMPSEYKVNGALRELRAFAELFDCPNGSYMNPQQRCDA